MKENLIIDVGMHQGRDTERYLAAGYDVVAVEADPRLAKLTGERLRHYVEDGRLKILEVAITDFDGETEFFTNPDHDDWGTVSPDFVKRNVETYKSSHERIVVPCTRFVNVLREHGVPYYLKVDIEGLDLLCVEALFEVEERPRYISIEPDQMSFEGAFTELAALWRLGYDRFKIVEQRGDTSGPFGEATPGAWLTIEDILVQWRRVLALQRQFGNQGGWQGKRRGSVWHSAFERYRRLRGQGPLGWFDFHARHGRDH